ncbi:9135_t:CDS:1 [Diversispora eburnea]|uniref:9135_t:CDS:1 n=1 Tax=Diversispora eburnea TaxID=1213867 RepID=A0A9N9G7Q5_9GLOM|nr:9135_t:CDS:1 [Diversispora eburnea]
MKFSNFCLLTVVVILFSPGCFAFLTDSEFKKLANLANKVTISIKETTKEILSESIEVISNFPFIPLMNLTKDKFIELISNFPFIPLMNLNKGILSKFIEFISNFSFIPLMNLINGTVFHIKEFIQGFTNEIVTATIGATVGCFSLGAFVMIIKGIGFQVVGILADSTAATMMSFLGTASWSIVPILQSIGAAGFSSLTIIGFPIFCGLLFLYLKT